MLRVPHQVLALTFIGLLLTACGTTGQKAKTMADRSGNAAVKTATQAKQAENVERVGDTQNFGDAMLTPLSDVNLKKQKVPTLLENMTNPYSVDGTNNCDGVKAQISDLDELLGADFDQAGFDEADFETKALNVTSSVVGGLIPFRGVIRTATGASEYDRQVRRAYRRGVTRRAFLKGIAKQRNCA